MGIVGGETEGPWITRLQSHYSFADSGFRWILPGSRFPYFQPTGSLGGASQSRSQNGHRRDKKDSPWGQDHRLLLLHESPRAFAGGGGAESLPLGGSLGLPTLAVLGDFSAVEQVDGARSSGSHRARRELCL